MSEGNTLASFLADQRPLPFKPDGIDAKFGRSFYWEDVPHYAEASKDDRIHYYRAFGDGRIIGLFMYYEKRKD